MTSNNGSGTLKNMEWQTNSPDNWETNASFSSDTVALNVWYQEALKRKFKFHKYETFDTEVDIKDVIEGDEIILCCDEGRKKSHTYCLLKGDNLVYMYQDLSRYKKAWVKVAGADEENVDILIKDYKALMPEPEPTSDKAIDFNFWYYTSRGAEKITRKISVPEWADIDGNYAPTTLPAISHLMQYDSIPNGGQLIMLLGSPGTGKTTSIRALSYEWREWATFNFIVDPETFLGSHSDYMMDVLLTDHQDYYDFEETADKKKDKWNILILEDAGELIAKDAKANVGQGLSRLLNIVDGLIGQGLKILILITSNEDIKKFDAAVTRPGRCLARVEYEEFEGEALDGWCKNHELTLPEDADSRLALADLYAYLNGTAPENKTLEKFGFGS